jgi:Ca-activated chloride channel family protein
MSAEEIFMRFASRVLLLECESSLGSGVLVSADGFVVTNAHVVEGCQNMTATLISGTSRRSYEPVLKYYDKKSDTAVLKITGQGFDSFTVLARSVRVGERVYAIGNPRGFEQSISEGIVSGNREEDGQLWIQHSAPISPGSSGGALISSRGELLGINSWFGKESQNLNFAVPASTLAHAFSGARALAGSLRFPRPAAITQTQATPPTAPPQEYSPTAPLPPSDPGPPYLRRGPQPGPSLPLPPPSAISGLPPGDLVIEETRKATAALIETLPIYVVKQFATRYRAKAVLGGKTAWRPIDTVTADIVLQDGKEIYTNLLVNGKVAKGSEFNSHRLGRSYTQTSSGSWSTGEYASLLQDVLSPLTNADFHGKRATTILNQTAFRYDFSVEQPNSHWHVEAEGQSYSPAYTGSIWIDDENYRVLRVELSAQNMPRSFPLDQVESAVNYDYVPNGDNKYLLPVHSESLSCLRGGNDCSRSVIDFRNYKTMSGALPSQSQPNAAERLVRLNVTVLDKFGHPIKDLPQSAFTVLENGAPQQIRIFKREDMPLSMALVIDNSANMRGQRSAVESAALAIVKDSDSQDEVIVVNFNDDVYLDTCEGSGATNCFTSNIKVMEHALTKIDSRGGTAMRDAINLSAGELKKKARRDKKVILVVTDGNDNASQISLDALTRVVQQDDVLIYAIGLPANEEKRKTKKAGVEFDAFVESTGGQVFYPKDASDVERIAHQVGHDIRDQYTIAYAPTNATLDGSFRQIKVAIKAPGSPVARTRSGYYATKDRP